MKFFYSASIIAWTFIFGGVAHGLFSLSQLIGMTIAYCAIVVLIDQYEELKREKHDGYHMD